MITQFPEEQDMSITLDFETWAIVFVRGIA